MLIHDFKPGGLGRFESPNDDHIQKYPFSAIPYESPVNLEKILPLPSWHQKHDQGNEGACVGFGISMMLAIVNMLQALENGVRQPYVRYNPWWLWDRAKEIDPWADTNPGDQNGTTVNAGLRILQTLGHVTWDNEADPRSVSKPNPRFGIGTFRWATSVDQVRASLAATNPVAIGVRWYTSFDTPEYRNGEYYIPNARNLGSMRGGHCVCIYGGSDQRQAVRIKNSWGTNYPEIWMPYSILDRLIREGGEIGLITDK